MRRPVFRIKKRTLVFLILSVGLRAACANPPVTEPQPLPASDLTSQQRIDRLIAQTYSITSESSANARTGSPAFRFALRTPVRLERLGKGVAKYSLGFMQAAWYHYGTNTSIALERRVLDFGRVKIDAGAAYARLSQYRRDGPGQDTRRELFPMLSFENRGNLHLNLLLAPSMSSSKPGVLFAQLAWRH
jgi:hypothetical protein